MLCKASYIITTNSSTTPILTVKSYLSCKEYNQTFEAKTNSFLCYFLLTTFIVKFLNSCIDSISGVMKKTEPWQDLGLPVGRGYPFLASQQVSLLEVTNLSSFTLSVYKPNFLLKLLGLHTYMYIGYMYLVENVS